MLLCYVGPFDAIEVPDSFGELVVQAERGVPVEVPDELAARLLAQGFDGLGRAYPDAAWQPVEAAAPVMVPEAAPAATPAPEAVPDPAPAVAPVPAPTPEA